MKTILVTGATGFIGKHLVQHLLLTHRVIGIGRNAGESHPEFRQIHADLINVTASQIGETVDAVIHLAWAGSAGAGRDNLQTQLHNVALTEAAIKLAVELQANRFIGVGTVTEGEISEASFVAHEGAGPAFIYGLAKTMAREIMLHRCAQANLSSTWARLGNVYAAQDPSRRFLSSTLDQLLRNEPVHMSSGAQWYDFLHIDDAVAGLVASLGGVNQQSYYIGSGQPKPLRAFVEQMRSLAQSDSMIEFGKAPERALPKESFSIDALVNDCNYSPKVSFDVGVQQMIETRHVR